MEKKKTLTIAMFSVCAAVIIGLIAAVAVLAAGSQTINSAINVTFTATSIDGTASATYTVGSTTTNMKVGSVSGTETVVDFKAADEASSYNLVPGDITLTETNKTVTFVYNFTNRGEIAYNAVVKYNDTNATDTNCKIEYQNGSDWVELGTAGATVNVAGKASDATADTTGSLTIRVTVQNVAKSAELSGNFAWTLTAVNA